MKKNNFRPYVDISVTHLEVTGSCILCLVKFRDEYGEIKTIKFIVDCGLFQEENYKKYNQDFPFNVRDLNFALVTHAHTDHTGRFPLLVKNGFESDIYTTKATKALMTPSLANSCKIQKSNAKMQKKVPLYDMKDVEKTLSLIKGYDFNKPIEITPNIKVTFFINGHLVGAALILVQISVPYEKDINILFTGDYKDKNMFFDVPELPQYVLDLPVTIVQESTYGKTDSNKIENSFSKTIIEAVKKRKVIVIPAFSLGRSQEILYLLKTMQKAGQIPLTVPIYLDGPLSQTYTSMYKKCDLGIKEEMKDFLPEKFEYITDKNRPYILENGASKIIVTSSGMGSNGPAQTHIPVALSNPNGLVHFTSGFMAEGTLGKKLKKTLSKDEDTVLIGGRSIKMKGELFYTEEFSAHAKSKDLVEFPLKFKHPVLICLNHGALNTQKVLKEKMSRQGIQNITLLQRETVVRINSSGFVKTMKSKFS